MEPFFFTTTSAELADETEAEVASLRLFALWLEPTFEAEAVATAEAVVPVAAEADVKALLARPANEELCGKASFGS